VETGEPLIPAIGTESLSRTEQGSQVRRTIRGTDNLKLVPTDNGQMADWIDARKGDHLGRKAFCLRFTSGAKARFGVRNARLIPVDRVLVMWHHCLLVCQDTEKLD